MNCRGESCGGGRKCVKKGKFCDGIIDCEDGIDEIYCKCEDIKAKHGTKIVPANLLTCHNSSILQDCIPQQWVCDGHPDCPGETDEMSCNPQENKIGKLNIILNHHISNLSFAAPKQLHFSGSKMMTFSNIYNAGNVHLTAVICKFSFAQVFK